MPYNPTIHKRQSIRLKGYDYSKEGLYFITISCQDKACLFGKIENEEMILNEAGEMIEKWYEKLAEKFPDIQIHEMTMMPNHFHCIIENTGGNVGATPCGRPVSDSTGHELNEIAHKNNLPEIQVSDNPNGSSSGQPILGDHMGSPLRSVIGWFKTMTTNEYIRGVKNHGWEPFNKRLWQRNYYEHIIRNQRSYQLIAGYILSNPAKWPYDTFYKDKS